MNFTKMLIYCKEKQQWSKGETRHHTYALGKIVAWLNDIEHQRKNNLNKQTTHIENAK